MTPAAAAGTGILIMLTFFSIGVALFIFWIMSLVDVIKNDFKNPNNKIIWILLLLLFAPLGTVLYQTIGKNQKV